MCGISGIIDFKNTIHKRELLNSMNQVLRHRGPDDQGIWESADATVTFGHTRLSILDISTAGHQPMIDPETGNAIVFNGEIFNFPSLREDYLKDEQFYSGTDTEVLLKLYRKLGIEMLPLLDGMFAFAIFDQLEKAVLLARDFSGKKPLYVTQAGNKFSFSSEIKALLKLPYVKATLDDEAFYDFLTFTSVSSPKSMFKGIEKFTPGHYMKIQKDGRYSYQAFKSLKGTDLKMTSEREWTDYIFNTFTKSVKDRMLSDVPVGLFLSGGVDSSAILATMHQLSNSKIRSFSIGFENQEDYNETIYAEKVSALFGSEHSVKIVKKSDLLEFLPLITEIYDEPQADTTSIPIYFISKLASESNIKVILNGDGADELFAGYQSFLKYQQYHRYYRGLEKLPLFAKKTGSWLTQQFSEDSIIHEFTERLSKKQEFFWAGASGLKESQKRKLLSNEWNQKTKHFDSYRYIQQLRNAYSSSALSNKDFINWMCFSSYQHADRERFLYRSDRLGMANSIEARSPFLSFDMIQLALNIPGYLKIKEGIPKYILKKSFERILPSEILYRKKMGFCLPLKEWAGNTIIHELESEIDLFCKETNYLNLKEVKRQIEAFKKGNNSYLNRIWTIYFFMKWYKKWM